MSFRFFFFFFSTYNSSFLFFHTSFNNKNQSYTSKIQIISLDFLNDKYEAFS